MATFPSTIRSLLSQLKENPTEKFQDTVFFPLGLLQEMKQYLAEISIKKKNAKTIIQREVLDNGIEKILTPVILKFNAIGINYENDRELVKSALKYALDSIVLNYPMHLKWTPVRAGIHIDDQKLKAYDDLLNFSQNTLPSPYNELQYCLANALLAKTISGWKVTPLGDLFLSLSLPASIVLLLTIENYFSIPKNDNLYTVNDCYMPYKFLKDLFDSKGAYVDIGDGEYSLLEHDPNMSYLNRLEEMGLLYTIDRTDERRSPQDPDGIPVFYIADDFYEIQITDLGNDVFEHVLNQDDNKLLALAKNLIRFDIQGDKYFNLNDSRTISDLQTLLNRNSDIVGLQKKVIDEILEDIKQGKTSAVTLRSILPSIEAICKNILVKEGLLAKGDTKTTLGSIIRIFRDRLSTKPILTDETINYIDSLDRNKILHGNVTPTDQILEAYINLALNVLKRILQEYN